MKSPADTPPVVPAPAAPARREDRLFNVAIALVALAGIGLGAWASWKRPTATSPEPQRRLAEFALLDRTGRPVTRADLTNRFLVVNGVFSSCSLSCRAVNERMAEIQQLTADQPDVLLVSVTVDPRTDTPAVLSRFADGYGARTNRWLFLTGPKAEVYRLLETSLFPKSPELVGLVPGGFANLDRILLLDPEGRVRASFNGLRPSAGRELTNTLDRLRRSLPP